MPSNAFNDHLMKLLEDAKDLLLAHRRLRTGQAGRQWRLAALNRAVVVTCVSAWEGYVEEVLLEAVNTLRPAVGGPLGNWPALNASARSAIGRFHNPNVDQVRTLFSDGIGLADITASWRWRSCTVEHARDLLTRALRHRQEIAHGVNPRPIIHVAYATQLPAFFRRLGSQTDAGIREFLVNTLGIANPWPV